jgi:hypothetical protein
MFFYFEKHSSLLQRWRCIFKFQSRRIGSKHQVAYCVFKIFFFWILKHSRLLQRRSCSCKYRVAQVLKTIFVSHFEALRSNWTASQRWPIAGERLFDIWTYVHMYIHCFIETESILAQATYLPTYVTSEGSFLNSPLPINIWPTEKVSPFKIVECVRSYEWIKGEC